MALGRSKKRLGDLLLDEGLITGEQLEKTLKLAKETGKRIGETLVENGIVTERDIMNALSHQLGIEIVSLIGVEISKELLGLVDASILRKNRMVPIDFYNGNVNVVRLAMADPMDMAAVDDFMMITNLQVEPVLALRNEIIRADLFTRSMHPTT